MNQNRTENPEINQPVPKNPDQANQHEPNSKPEREIDLPNKESENPQDKKDIKGKKA